MEAPGSDPLVGDGVGDELPGELVGLRAGYGPGSDVAAEDVEEHVEVVVGRLVGPASLVMSQLHTTLAPGHELVAHPGRVGGPAPALAELAAGPQQRYIVDMEAR